jgi:RNA polymerase sigma factor (sigma-70 family)
MSPEDSLSAVRRYCGGDDRAAAEILDRYAARLVALARSRLSAKLGRKLDAEDVVQSALGSFFVRVRKGQFDLRRGGDLWRLLAAITVNKALGQAERFCSEKRRLDVEESWRESNAILLEARGRFRSAPYPRDALELLEELDLVARQLPPAHRDILTARLEGASLEDLAAEHQVTERQIRRVLQKVETQLLARLHAVAAG